MTNSLLKISRLIFFNARALRDLKEKLTFRKESADLVSSRELHVSFAEGMTCRNAPMAVFLSTYLEEADASAGGTAGIPPSAMSPLWCRMRWM